MYMVCVTPHQTPENLVGQANLGDLAPRHVLGE